MTTHMSVKIVHTCYICKSRVGLTSWICIHKTPTALHLDTYISCIKVLSICSLSFLNYSINYPEPALRLPSPKPMSFLHSHTPPTSPRTGVSAYESSYPRFSQLCFLCLSTPAEWVQSNKECFVAINFDCSNRPRHTASSWARALVGVNRCLAQSMKDKC